MRIRLLGIFICCLSVTLCKASNNQNNIIANSNAALRIISPNEQSPKFKAHSTIEFEAVLLFPNNGWTTKWYIDTYSNNHNGGGATYRLTEQTNNKVKGRICANVEDGKLLSYTLHVSAVHSNPSDNNENSEHTASTIFKVEGAKEPVVNIKLPNDISVGNEFIVAAEKGIVRSAFVQYKGDSAGPWGKTIQETSETGYVTKFTPYKDGNNIYVVFAFIELDSGCEISSSKVFSVKPNTQFKIENALSLNVVSLTPDPVKTNESATLIVQVKGNAPKEPGSVNCFFINKNNTENINSTAVLTSDNKATLKFCTSNPSDYEGDIIARYGTVETSETPRGQQSQLKPIVTTATKFLFKAVQGTNKEPCKN